MNDEKVLPVSNEPPKKTEVKNGPAVKCKLQFKGMIHYGRAIRQVNGRKYDLAIDEVTLVEPQDLEGLKEQEPNLYIIK